MHQDPINELKRLKQFRRSLVKYHAGLLDETEEMLNIISLTMRGVNSKAKISQAIDRVLDMKKRLKGGK